MKFLLGTQTVPVRYVSWPMPPFFPFRKSSRNVFCYKITKSSVLCASCNWQSFVLVRLYKVLKCSPSACELLSCWAVTSILTSLSPFSPSKSKDHRSILESMSLPLLLPNAWNNLQLHSYRVKAGLLTRKGLVSVPQPQQLQGSGWCWLFRASIPAAWALGSMALRGCPVGALSSTCGSHECSLKEPAAEMGPQPSDYIGHMGGEAVCPMLWVCPPEGVSAHGQEVSAN